jgi:hypothetical protein
MRAIPVARRYSFLLSMVLVLFLAGCGNVATPVETNTPAATTETSAAPQPTSTETTAAPINESESSNTNGNSAAHTGEPNVAQEETSSAKESTTTPAETAADLGIAAGWHLGERSVRDGEENTTDQEADGFGVGGLRILSCKRLYFSFHIRQTVFM